MDAVRSGTLALTSLDLASCFGDTTGQEHPLIQLKRVYEKADPRDGVRFLVERLWPRGLRKDDIRLEGWQKDAAPSTELRKWFAHDPAKWAEFRRKYFAELKAQPEAWAPILKAAQHRTVTLLYKLA